MKVIAIDTSRGNIDLIATAVAGSSTFAVDKNQSIKTVEKRFETAKAWPFRIEEHIATAVKKVLEKLGETPDLVIINLGPGSYTSLRSGIAFVNGWYQGLKKKNGKEPFELVGVKNSEFPKLPSKESYVNNIVKKGIKSYTEGRTNSLKELVPVYGVKNNENVHQQKQ